MDIGQAVLTFSCGRQQKGGFFLFVYSAGQYFLSLCAQKKWLLYSLWLVMAVLILGTGSLVTTPFYQENKSPCKKVLETYWHCRRPCLAVQLPVSLWHSGEHGSSVAGEWMAGPGHTIVQVKAGCNHLPPGTQR